MEGSSTVITNLHACASVLACPVDALARFFAWKVNARVVIYPDSVAVYAPLDPAAPQALVAAFIEECLRCRECKKINCKTCPYPPDPIPPEVATRVLEVLE